MTVLSNFEVLAETLVPKGVLPPTAVNPFLVQGYFVQISLSPDAPASAVQFNLIFQETTDFTQGAGQKALFAQFIDAKGGVNIYSQFFASTGRGFLGQQIFRGQTLIYGVQALPPQSAAEAAALPQGGTGWRGTVRIEANASGALIATPTQRLVYYNAANPFTASVLDAVVYGVPTATGGTVI
jgi:hypothetical protein